MQDFQPEERAAKFNSGIAKLFRMGDLRKGCHDARISKNYKLWFPCLQGLRSEMNSKFTSTINKKQKENKEKTEREIANKYEQKIKNFLESTKQDKEIDIYNLLFEYELWLGDMEEKYKFGMPDSDSAYEALK